MKILGTEAPQHYISKLNAEQKPWYLRPNYDQAEILIDPDGGVRAGTPMALVERLTAHELAGELLNGTGENILLLIVRGRYHIYQELLDDFQIVYDLGRAV